MGKLTILAKAKALFCSYGLRSISMDDLAKQAGVSKKTIYQCYTDKNELVNTIVQDMVSSQVSLFATCEDEARDAVEEVLLKADATLRTWATVSQPFFMELERSFPESWKKLLEHKDGVLEPGIKRNLQRGITEGLYRSELDLSFTAAVSLHHHVVTLQTNAFTQPGRNPSQVFKDLTHFYLHGICTEKGKKYLNKYINNVNENRKKNETTTA